MQRQNHQKNNSGKFLTHLFAAGLLGAFVLGYALAPKISPLTYSAESPKLTGVPETTLPLPILHLETPEPLKAVYMTQCVAGTPSFRQKLVDLADRTEINSIVIDIKDYSGRLAFPTENPRLKDAVSPKCRADDIREFVKKLHNLGIYVIGRIAVFQDPFMVKARPELAVRKKSDGSVWKDYKGLSFIDVGAWEHWDYTALIAKEAYNLGFDEINFDYVRYPSDGNMEDVIYTFSGTTTKPEMLRQFFSYLHDVLKDIGMKTSVDLFGMTTTNTDDLNIGQVLENALPYFDYVSPMVYPSHYPPDFNGWKDPNKYPYEVVKFSMESAVKRAEATTTTIKLFDSVLVGTTTATSTITGKQVIKNIYSKKPYDKNKLRPWLQDFQYGGTYGPKEVRAQIQATYDVGLTSWMLWSPSNRYTEAALDPVR